ncbi:alpha/beta fold hydrolase [Plantactinospora sp. GCM10030261]|uniref:alpha/beta fold hydrolase n=1 Tax=Plantactinospora sp. GCM10030261 TaxID=3273420 RepID=UPI00361160D6
MAQRKSTIVRVYSLPWTTRAAFRLLDRLAPALSARWAERIWFTLPRTRSRPASGARRSADRSASASARPDTTRPVTTEGPGPGATFAVEVDGHRVVGTAWGHGPVVYLVHGWAGRHQQLTALVAPLVAAGHRVVAFDAPSHGASAPGRYGPRSSSIPEFAAALTAVVAVHGPAYAVIAHSLGATATAVALCDGLRAGRLVLLAPMASPAWFAEGLARVLGFGPRTHRRLTARVERRVGAPMRHFDVPELGRAVAMPPTLVIHDRDDTYTPVSDGAAIAAAWPRARLHVTSGLGHRRLLRDPAVLAETVAFVTTATDRPDRDVEACRQVVDPV